MDDYINYNHHFLSIYVSILIAMVNTHYNNSLLHYNTRLLHVNPYQYLLHYSYYRTAGIICEAQFLRTIKFPI